MMKPSEVRIGNILDRGRIVAAITKDYYKDTEDLATLFRDAKPELLTAEWLRSFNPGSFRPEMVVCSPKFLAGLKAQEIPNDGPFKFTAGTGHKERVYSIAKNDHPENIGWCMWDMTNGGRHVANLHYVHEFQNIWLDLTGQDLTKTA